MFVDKDHENSFKEFMKRAHVTNEDTERRSSLYLLALNPETRKHIIDLYDFKNNCILLTGLNNAWQTGSSIAITRLAFNLYNGFIGEDESCKVTPLHIFSHINNNCWDYVMFGIKLRWN